MPLNMSFDLKVFARRAESVLAQDLQEASDAGFKNMRAGAPVATGALFRSMKQRVAGPLRRIFGFDSSGLTFYGIYQNYGFRHYWSGRQIPGKFFLQRGLARAVRLLNSRGYRTGRN